MENVEWFRLKNDGRNGKFIDEPIVEYREKMFDEEILKGNKVRVCIGTDSQEYAKWKFATVILVIVAGKDGIGKGGKIIYKTYKLPKNMQLNQRMIEEVSQSINVAVELNDLMELYEIPMEIHADITPDPRWGSNSALSEAVGYILGMGYDFKVKPDAWASSKAADRLC